MRPAFSCPGAEAARNRTTYRVTYYREGNVSLLSPEHGGRRFGIFCICDRLRKEPI